jgi:hypothetical protein
MFSGSFLAANRVLALLAILTVVVVGAGTALAQTPDEACAADSLYLLSPDDITTVQQVVGRPGLILSWPDLPIDDATCYTLTGVDALGYDVVVTGGFGDQVDRLLVFEAEGTGGTIGHEESTSLLVNWQSQGANPTGVLAGTLNLANNGGVLRYDESAGNWVHTNEGFPMTWARTNVVAFAQGADGFQVAAITSGATLETGLQGLWLRNEGTWSRVSAQAFTATSRVTRVAVSPTDNNRFAVGTAREGVFVTSDGGQTFTRFRSELDPNLVAPEGNVAVAALNWDSSRLLVFASGIGLYVSEDNGASFQRSEILVPDDLALPEPQQTLELPALNAITVDPSNADRILVGLDFHGVWESLDGGDTWHDLYGDLNIIPDWERSVKSLAVDSTNSQVMVVGVRSRGLFRTGNGGANWVRVAEDLQPSNLSELVEFSIKASPVTGGLFYAQEDGHSLLVSTDGGVTWASAAEQPFIPTGLQLLFDRENSGDLLLATTAGGIYIPGSPLLLSETFNTLTAPSLRNINLGLEASFGNGEIIEEDTFSLVCQTFQGWAVWRAPSHDPDNMVLLGMYDRVNPESCIEGYCGDASYDLSPQCYASKRAACFHFDTPDTIRFFDDEVYNGFSYYYAVGTFDYGNTAQVSPQNNNNAMVFSARFPQDENSPFSGVGNRIPVQINSGTTDPVAGETIYVYPNPLRRDAGIPGSEGEMVVFTNLPPESRIRVFTTAGDDVINLGPEVMQAGNIYWNTRNREGEAIAPGVYLYKAESPAREEHWGKLVVIR